MSRNGDYDNTNRGALFVNDRKENENHPDWQGQVDVGGVEYWISGWKKKSKKGDPYIRVAIKEKEARKPQRGNSRNDPPPSRGRDDNDDIDDIPW